MLLGFGETNQQTTKAVAKWFKQLLVGKCNLWEGVEGRERGDALDLLGRGEACQS